LTPAKTDAQPSRKQLELLLAVLASVSLVVAALFLVDPDHDLSKREAFFLILLVLGGILGVWNNVRTIWTREKKRAATYLEVVAFVGGLAAGFVEWRILSALWPSWGQDEIFLLMFLNVVAAGVLEARLRR
jgi:hypothetical protein